MLWQAAIGAMWSSTVTVEEQVEVFPLLSSTERVTVFAPTFAQVKEEGATLIEAIPQASVDPLSIWAAVIEALPDASNCTVMLWQVAIGAMWSSTVTVEEQVEEFPLLSVTVRVAVFAPTFAQ